jgi:hypothetical protein
MFKKLFITLNGSTRILFLVLYLDTPFVQEYELRDSYDYCKCDEDQLDDSIELELDNESTHPFDNIYINEQIPSIFNIENITITYTVDKNKSESNVN